MDFTPIYELRERLRAAAVAGTELISEDFRLRRALEAIKPLEAASPVFAKIGQLVRTLTSDGCTNRSDVLLEAITLVDALLCTQAATAVKADIEPIDLPNVPVTTADIPASTLKALIEALTSSGSGHYSYVIDTHDRQPELFKDYRIKTALVRALGASYAELADKAAEWLKSEGEDIVPLLKRGFDPKGGREMVRRVQIIDAVAGAKENDFYISMLETAEKDIRNALIYALRSNVSNAGRLIEMSKTEKGNCKKMVYWTLSELECDEAAVFYETYAAKKPLDAAAYIETTSTSWASKLTAREFLRLLKKSEVPEDFFKADGDQLAAWLRALPSKRGEEICECYRSAAALRKTLDTRKLADETHDWAVKGIPEMGNDVAAFSDHIKRALLLALVMPHDRSLDELAIELNENIGGFFAQAMAAAVQMYDSGEAINWLESKLWKKSLLGKKINTELVEQLTDVCSLICWDNESNGYMIRRGIVRPSDEKYITYSRGLDGAIIQYLTAIMVKFDTRMDKILINWVSPEKNETNQIISEHFLKMAHKVKNNQIYLHSLRTLNADCSGLAVEYFKKNTKVSYWEILSYFNVLPATNEVKAADARKVYEMIKSKQLEVRNFYPSRFEEYISSLENNTNEN